MTAYICYFDSLGFEWIFNVTDYERKKTMAYLKGEGKVDLPIPGSPANSITEPATKPPPKTRLTSLLNKRFL